MSLARRVGVPIGVLAIVATIIGAAAGHADVTIAGMIVGSFCSATVLAALSEENRARRARGRTQVG